MTSVESLKDEYYVRRAIIAPSDRNYSRVEDNPTYRNDDARIFWKNWKNDSKVYGNGTVFESNKLADKYGGYVPPDKTVSEYYKFTVYDKHKMLIKDEMEARYNEDGKAISVDTNNSDLLRVVNENDNPAVRQKARTLLGWQYVNEKYGTKSLDDQIKNIPPEVKQEVEDWYTRPEGETQEMLTASSCEGDVLDRMDDLETRMDDMEERISTMETYTRQNSHVIEKMNDMALASVSLGDRVCEIRHFLETHTFDDPCDYEQAKHGLTLLEELVHEQDESQQSIKNRWTRHNDSSNERDQKVGAALNCLLQAGMDRLFGFYPVHFWPTKPMDST